MRNLCCAASETEFETETAFLLHSVLIITTDHHYDVLSLLYLPYAGLCYTSSHSPSLHHFS